MFFKRHIRSIVLLALFTLVFGGSVMADDGRINRAPYHFGGDTLFCNQEKGCTLLDKDGHELANWPESDVMAAIASQNTSKQNTQVAGEGQGTYGAVQLWAVGGNPENGNDKLCMMGFDEWGKPNSMCFEVTKDYHFQQAPLPTAGSTDCQVDLAANHFKSRDGIHSSVGFDIWSTDSGMMVAFLRWSDQSEGLVACNLAVA